MWLGPDPMCLVSLEEEGEAPGTLLLEGLREKVASVSQRERPREKPNCQRFGLGLQSHICEEVHFCCLSRPAWGALVLQPELTMAAAAHDTASFLVKSPNRMVIPRFSSRFCTGPLSVPPILLCLYDQSSFPGLPYDLKNFKANKEKNSFFYVNPVQLSYKKRLDYHGYSLLRDRDGELAEM